MPVNFDKITAFFTPIHSGQPDATHTSSYIVPIFNWIIGLFLFLGAAFAVIAILYGGISYITAGGDQSKTEKARNTILYGIIGALVIIFAFVIIKIVSGVAQGLT